MLKRSKAGGFAGLLLVGAVVVVAYLMSLLDFFQGLELRLYDLALQRRGALPTDSTQVAVVAIDQQTFDTLAYPLNRTYYADLIVKLNHLGAKRIVFDVLFTGQGASPQSDSLFKAAITEAGNVVLCGEISTTYQRGLAAPLAAVITPHSSIAPAGTPWGIVNDFLDPDGVTRRYPLFLTARDSVYLSLGMKVFALERGIQGGELGYSPEGDLLYAGLKIPRVTSASTALLNFYGPAGTFPTYSFIDVIAGSYDFAALLAELSHEEQQALAASGAAEMLARNPFEGKIVLVGASAEDLQDNKITPFFSARNQHRTPGVEVHANALQMFADRSFIRPVGFWLVLVGVLLVSLLTYVTGRHIAHWSGIIVAGGLFLLVMISSVLLFTKGGLWLRQVPLLLAIGIGYPTNLLYRFILSQREKAMIRGMFSQYVPKSYVHQLIQHPELLQLGGERRRMSMLFTDVAGFTTVSERLTPEELVALLNEYLTAMSRVVFENEGIVDKYEGDLVMAEFGAPIWNPNHAAQACRTGLGMQAKLRELRKKWHSEGRPELESRVGINTGDVIVGNMGSEEKFDYTVMGDAVNLASRLEGANKEYGSTIMIGRLTYEDVKDSFVTRPLDLLRVKGKLEPVAVHELLAEKPEELDSAKQRAVALYLEGIELYRARRFEDADKLFLEALAAVPDDGPSQVYHRRCQLYGSRPPPPDWDGVWTLKEK